MARSEAQKRADKKYNEANREYVNYLRNRSATRGFIRNKATKEDLEELLEMIKKKLNSIV